MTAAVMPLLTARQRLILEFIRDFYTRHGYAPSLREIGIGAGLSSPSSVDHPVQQLHRMGWIRRHPGLPRALVVLNPADGSQS